MFNSPGFDSLRKEQEPLVSVIMPARNEEKYIGTAIESILEQGYRRLELIIVDDHSSDGTLRVAGKFHDPRISVYRKLPHENSGAASSRNAGVERARGGLVAYQDADDYSYPDRLERQVKEYQREETPGIIGTWVEYRLGASTRVSPLPVEHRSIVAGFNRCCNRVTFVSGTMLVPRILAIMIPGRSRFRYFEDWDQLCRLNELGIAEFRNVARPLYVYNVRPKGSKSQSDWASYNVFERACRAQRRRGLEEWQTKDEFERHLLRSPLDLLRWRGIQFLLHLKAQGDLRGLRARHRENHPSRTW